MKTQLTECNPSVTMTVSCVEAMTLWQALERLDASHRKTLVKPRTPEIGPKHRKERRRPRVSDDGKWGHPDCPPQIQTLLAAIKGSIHAEHPDLFEMFFGYKPEDYKPTIHGPLPQAVNVDVCIRPMRITPNSDLCQDEEYLCAGCRKSLRKP